jgi:hypothetical protein
MKSLRSALFTVLIVCGLLVAGKSNAQYTDLLSLSVPPAFGPLVGGGSIFFTGTGSQGATGIVVNGTINSGDLIFAPIATAQNFSSFVALGNFPALFMNIATPNPDVAFALEFLDSTDTSIDIWTGTTGATAVNGYVDFDTLGTPGTGDYSDVSSIIITWANPSPETIDATFTKLSVFVVPEPSTYALLALSGLALGGYALRRRRRA